jgi:hypothetical protein
MGKGKRFQTRRKSTTHHDDAEGMVDHPIHAHDVGRAHAHHDHRLLLKRGAGAGVDFLQLLHSHVKALPLGTIHLPKSSAADLSAHGKRGGALDMRCRTSGQLVGLESIPTLLGSSFARLDKSDQLLLLQQRLC